MSNLQIVALTETGKRVTESVVFVDGAASVAVQAFDALSINAMRQDIARFVRVGDDIEIHLTNGDILVLDGYFFDGAPPKLYLSSSGYISEVTILEDSATSILVSFEELRDAGKYDPLDDLRFYNEPVVFSDIVSHVVGNPAPFIVGALGIAALAWPRGGDAQSSSEDDVTPEPRQPTVASEQFVFNQDDLREGRLSIPVSGFANNGDRVYVKLADSIIEVEVQESGAWDVVFEGETFPQEGTHRVNAVVDGQVDATLLGSSVIVDFTPPLITIGEVMVLDMGVEASQPQAQPLQIARQATDDPSTADAIALSTTIGSVTGTAPDLQRIVIDADSLGKDIFLAGKTEIGSQLTVLFDDVEYAAEVDRIGNWSVVLPTGGLSEGEYKLDVLFSAIDAVGNRSEFSLPASVDTTTFIDINSEEIGFDGVVNSTERSAGIRVTGVSEPDARVRVEIEGTVRETIANPGGTWAVDFMPPEIPEGQRSVAVNATAIDENGNMSSGAAAFEIDTFLSPLTATSQAGGADGVVSEAEAAQGFTLTGQVEQSSSVEVTIGGQRMNAQVSGSTWSVAVPASVIPMTDGDTVSIQIAATDRAGNTKSITETMVVDNVAPDAPDMTAILWDQAQAPRGIILDRADHDISIVRVGAGGVQTVDAEEFELLDNSESTFAFNNVVPDGSHLVVTATDDAGNSTGTYIVLGDPNVSRNNVSLFSNIGGREIDVIDLEFTEEATLTITEAQIVAMTGEDNTVRVLGNSDETVRITGATRTGSRFEDGQNYDVYELGDATVLIDDDINNVTI